MEILASTKKKKTQEASDFILNINMNSKIIAILSLCSSFYNVETSAANIDWNKFLECCCF